MENDDYCDFCCHSELNGYPAAQWYYYWSQQCDPHSPRYKAIWRHLKKYFFLAQNWELEWVRTIYKVYKGNEGVLMLGSLVYSAISFFFFFFFSKAFDYCRMNSYKFFIDNSIATSDSWERRAHSKIHITLSVFVRLMFDVWCMNEMR